MGLRLMVPFRLNGSAPRGAIVWREVRIGLIAPLHRIIIHGGHHITRLRQQRLVAVLGSAPALAAHPDLEVLRQGLASAPTEIWVSDGERRFRRILNKILAPISIVGILDFYRTTGQLWTAAETWYFRQPC